MCSGTKGPEGFSHSTLMIGVHYEVLAFPRGNQDNALCWILDRNCKPADHGVGRRPFWPSAGKTSAVGHRFDPRRGGNPRRRPGQSIGKDAFLTTALCSSAPDHLGGRILPPSPQTTPRIWASTEATAAAEAGNGGVDSGGDLVL